MILLSKKRIFFLVLVFAANYSFAQAKCLGERKGCDPYLSEVKFSPDGTKILATYFQESSFHAKVWDRFGKVLYTIVVKDERDIQIISAEFSPDSTKIITNGEPVQIWDAAAGHLLFSLEDKLAPYDLRETASFSPDSKKIVTDTFLEKEPKVWDAYNGNFLFAISGHSDHVVNIIFSPDSQRIFTSGSDHVARLSDANNGEHLYWLYRRGSWLSESTSTAVRFKAGPLLPWVHEASFSPDGRVIATIADDNVAKVWEVATGKLLFSLKHEDWVQVVKISPNGQTIFTSSTDGTGKIWNAATGTLIHSFNDLNDSAIFSPDGSKLITREISRYASPAPRVWDVKTGALLFALHQVDENSSIEFSPDSQIIITNDHEMVYGWTNEGQRWPYLSASVDKNKNL